MGVSRGDFRCWRREAEHMDVSTSQESLEAAPVKPTADMATADPAAVMNAVEDIGITVPRLRPLRCVIVDDNRVIAEIAANLLGRDGITVVGMASKIAEALGCVAALKPDVTVVDVHLGRESGLELAEQLASVASPVILTSTNSAQEFADMITESAALGFVSKFDLSPSAIRHLLIDSAAQPE
jgi:CheY-like chemotaxis protein